MPLVALDYLLLASNVDLELFNDLLLLFDDVVHCFKGLNGFLLVLRLRHIRHLTDKLA